MCIFYLSKIEKIKKTHSKKKSENKFDGIISEALKCIIEEKMQLYPWFYIRWLLI